MDTTEDAATSKPSHECLLPDPRRPRLNPKEFPNSDFLNRLITATRITDLYSSNLAPSNLFYSELLRSLVQSKLESDTQQAATAAHNAQSQLQRRCRKRPWHHNRTPAENVQQYNQQLASSIESVLPEEKLSAKHNESIAADREKKLIDVESLPVDRPLPETTALCVDKDNDDDDGHKAKICKDNPADVIVPASTPPNWYPSALYPPYGIDPLHFFIDLRVSGHIYDEAKKPLPPIDGLESKVRQGSAFSVVPASTVRSNYHGLGTAPMNLSTGQQSTAYPGHESAQKRTQLRDKFDQQLHTGGVAEAGEEQFQKSVFTKHQQNRNMMNDEVIAVDDHDTN